MFPHPGREPARDHVLGGLHHHHQLAGHYQVNLRIANTGSTPINGWTMRYQFANGQSIYDLWGGTLSCAVPLG